MQSPFPPRSGGAPAAVRFSWAAGTPLGISEQMLREGQQTGLWFVEFNLAVVPGALATLVILPAAMAFVRVPFSALLPMPENLTTIGPGLLRPLWAIGLGIATTSYVVRWLRPARERA